MTSQPDRRFRPRRLRDPRPSAVPAAPAPISAGKQSFDGTWSVLIVTEKGTCDRAYRYPVRISNGSVGYAGEASFNVSGRVGANGAVTVMVSKGNQSAKGTGQLSANDGSGRWTPAPANAPAPGPPSAAETFSRFDSLQPPNSKPGSRRAFFSSASGLSGAQRSHARPAARRKRSGLLPLTPSLSCRFLSPLSGTTAACTLSQTRHWKVRRSMPAFVGCGSIPVSRIGPPHCVQAGPGSGRVARGRIR